MKIYPLEKIKPLFSQEDQTFEDVGVKIIPTLDGIRPTSEMIKEKTKDGLKKLICLEFNWLPSAVVKAFNSAKDEKERMNILVNKVYGNCRLNCKGCYVKQDSLYKGNDLIYPYEVIALIEEAVKELGTMAIRYLGPTEFFNDRHVFEYLDKFQEMGIVINIFVKDPMFGDDQEVEKLFGGQGIRTARQLIERLSQYENLRIIFNFASFDDEKTNDLVKDGYKGKQNYLGDYKKAQTRAIQLFYEYFTKHEIAKGKPSRLMIVNSMITPKTINEALEIFKYFLDRGVPVCSTTSMQSGCGSSIYASLDTNFLEKLAHFYALAINHSIKRGVISQDSLLQHGPSPYAGIEFCIQLCNGLLIRETGQLMRCPGADHDDWQDDIPINDLLEKGLTWAWLKTKNYRQRSEINVGCLAKPKIFTPEFNRRVTELYKNLQN